MPTLFSPQKDSLQAKSTVSARAWVYIESSQKQVWMIQVCQCQARHICDMAIVIELRKITGDYSQKKPDRGSGFLIVSDVDVLCVSPPAAT